MLNSHSLRITLNIKDKRIDFSDNCVSHKIFPCVKYLVFKGTLSLKAPRSCPICGSMNQSHDIIKHGSKTIRIKMPRISNQRTFLELKKQRYRCKHCLHTFTLSSSIVKDNHSISENTYHSCILSCKDKLSIKDIARNHDISHDRVNKWIEKIAS